MTRIREHNNDIKPAIPYVALFDAGGSQTINGSFLTWDTIKCKTSHFHYTADDDKIQLNVNSSGLFDIAFNVSLSGGGTSYFEIYKNDSSIAESKTYGIISASMQYIIFLQKGDYIQIKGTSASGSNATYANTSRLLIKFIPMRGWDNNESGRKSFIGRVNR